MQGKNGGGEETEHTRESWGTSNMPALFYNTNEMQMLVLNGNTRQEYFLF